MYILNLEDNVFKRHAIQEAVKEGSFRNLKIDYAGNLNEGIEKIRTRKEQGNPYDLIITDMWFPEVSGGKDEYSGKKLIEMAEEQEWGIPIIVCSSINYQFQGILGSVHYSEKENWESQLVNLIRKLN